MIATVTWLPFALRAAALERGRDRRIRELQEVSNSYYGPIREIPRDELQELLNPESGPDDVIYDVTP